MWYISINLKVMRELVYSYLAKKSKLGRRNRFCIDLKVVSLEGGELKGAYYIIMKVGG